MSICYYPKPYYLILLIMTETEVFEIVRKRLIEQFPHCFRLWALMCYEPACEDKNCAECLLHRSCVTSWEVSIVLPQLEREFGKKYPVSPPEFYEVIKFFADS